MVIDGGVRSTEYHLHHKIVSQEVMRKAEFDFRGFVQIGDLFASGLPVKTLQVVLNLRGAASTDNWDDWHSALAQPVERDLRSRTSYFLSQLHHCLSDPQLSFIRRIGFGAVASGLGFGGLGIFAAENATGQRTPRRDANVKGARHRKKIALRFTLREAVFDLQTDERAPAVNLGECVGLRDNPCRVSEMPM